MQGDLGFLKLITGLFKKPKPPAPPPAAAPAAGAPGARPVMPPAAAARSNALGISLPMLAAGALVVYLLAKKGK